MQQTKTSGLTLIEILIAMSLLAIMTGFVVSSLAGSFQITRASRKALDATASVQRVVEEIRGQWQTRALFDNSCATIDLTPDASPFLTLTATRLYLTSSATASTAAVATNITTTGCASFSAPAAGTTCPVSMQRVVIVASDNTDGNKILGNATLDVVCP